MNKVFLFLQRFGGMKELPVLIVAGRKSQKPRRTPLTVITLDGERYLLEGFPGADGRATSARPTDSRSWRSAET